ncbi:hypothetical protein LTR62_001469 [Meristemomyces frigidus]|uniref:Uncharacterized protein n=1 Tax=Meristemomyces frigidus TaxID=1508187 RepID=A0AAN7YQJ7_9PEZI|nr:hypothetical protein LTR62_001469 [Meristemomyces frigidus]
MSYARFTIPLFADLTSANIAVERCTRAHNRAQRTLQHAEREEIIENAILQDVTQQLKDTLRMSIHYHKIKLEFDQRTAAYLAVEQKIVSALSAVRSAEYGLWKAEANKKVAEQEYYENQAAAQREEREKMARERSSYHGTSGREGSSSHQRRPRPTGSHTKLHQSPGKQQLTHAQQIASFLVYAEDGFRNYSTLTAFPSPPALPCRHQECASTRADRALDACCHDIRTAFAGVTNLKVWRTIFHPDRFCAIKDHGLRIEAQRKAQEVFVVLSDMMDGVSG